eukprot:CAMPEP_0117673980 /NCGR_PEP_ID=MMETSP0804-20121206/14780_1 /TAXON_ID=1074897 /ORGANISM="Tetraselmis astigmatica, Strain CCMP880" /LENGTH=423 /DNA_ID=CAMNT_0005482791 /DNA_START=96 /DNA_END=1367 /DNA_ORIENTATION=+
MSCRSFVAVSPGKLAASSPTARLTIPDRLVAPATCRHRISGRRLTTALVRPGPGSSRVTVRTNVFSPAEQLANAPSFEDTDSIECKTHLESGGDHSKNYDFERWAKHESPWRYWRHITSIFHSRVLHDLRWIISAVTLFATGVCCLYTYGAEPLLQMGIALPIAPLAPFTLMSSVIGLLLVFRTNSSYSRWYEARGLWGLAVNRLRDINRQASTWWTRGDPALAQARLETLQRWTTALIFSLKHHLRPGGSLEADLEDVLPSYELRALMSVDHKPLYALQVCSELNRVSGAEPELQTRIDRNFTIMEDVIGACEKILRTPIPVSYTRHTSRFLTMWTGLLPLALWPVCGWFTIPVSTMIAFFMFGIEDIGVFIEEPFSYLQLHAIASVIERTTLEVLWCHGVDHEGLSARDIVANACKISPGY